MQPPQRNKMMGAPPKEKRQEEEKKRGDRSGTEAKSPEELRPDRERKPKR